jgi:hypothetical protein
LAALAWLGFQYWHALAGTVVDRFGSAVADRLGREGRGRDLERLGLAVEVRHGAERLGTFRIGSAVVAATRWDMQGTDRQDEAVTEWQGPVARDRARQSRSVEARKGLARQSSEGKPRSGAS